MHCRNEPFELVRAKREPFARGGGGGSVRRPGGRRSAGPAAAAMARRDRDRETASPAAAIGHAIECEDQGMVFISLRLKQPETGQKENPVGRRGFCTCVKQDVYRARRSEAPGRGPFFEIAAHEFVIIGEIMMDAVQSVNAQQKKPGSKEPGSRYWPREADTITFQEGLLNFRATGGGGQNAQRERLR